jgi:hypothetical protein
VESSGSPETLELAASMSTGVAYANNAEVRRTKAEETLMMIKFVRLEKRVWLDRV